MFAKLFATLILIFAPLIAAAEVRVIDGDTIEIDGTHYRINGIDAPEHGQKCGGWSCGKDATDALIALVKNQDIVCQTIANDGYGREIATCYAGDIDIGRAMVEAGHAWAFLFAFDGSCIFGLIISIILNGSPFTLSSKLLLFSRHICITLSQ